MFLKSKFLIFLLLRYSIYGVQLILIFLLARELNPYYFGVYSTIALYLQYLSFTTLGVPYELNVRLSIVEKQFNDLKRAYISNAFSKVIYIFSLIALLAAGIYFSDFRIIDDPDSNVFLFFIVAITFLQGLSELFMNMFRAQGTLWMINLSQALPLAGQIIGLVLGKTPVEKILYLLGFQALGMLIYCLLAVYTSSVILSSLYKWKSEIGNISLKNSLYLLIYNLSYVLILLSSRTIVSTFFSVDEFGLYSFASNVANIITIALGSISFAVFSKLVGKLNLGLNSLPVIKEVLEMTRDKYLFLNILFTLCGLSLLPVVILILPQFKGTETLISYLLFTQLILGNIFGYGPLLISNGQTKTLIIHGVTATLITVLSSSIFVLLGMNLSFQAVATLIGGTYYLIAVIYSGEKHLQGALSLVDVFKIAFPKNSFLIISIAMLIVIFKLPWYFGVILTAGFLSMNIKQISSLKKLIRNTDFT